jgi:hypothetical protein
MNRQTPTPMILRPGFSRRLAAALLAVHAGGCGVLPMLPLPGLVSWFLWLLLAGSLVHYWRRDLSRQGRWAVTELRWDGTEVWTLFGPDGRPQTAKLHGSSYLQQWGMILNFSTGGWIGRTVLLLEDNVEPEQLRQLSARLRLRYKI